MKVRFAAICALFSLTASLSVPAQGEETPWTILEKFAATQTKCQKIWFKFTTAGKANAHYTAQGWGHLSGARRAFDKGELRYDGNRAKVLFYQWGNVEDANVFIPESQARYNSTMWDGEKYVQYATPFKGVGKPHYAVIDLWKKENYQKRNREIATVIYEDFLDGYFGGHRLRIDELLRQNKDLTLKKEMETLNGVPCYVLEAKIPQGDTTAWFDPTHGFHCVQIKMDSKAGNTRPNSTAVMKPGQASRYLLRTTRFQMIDNTWIPVEGTMFHHKDLLNNQWDESTATHQRTEIRLNPDFDKDKAFAMDDIQDGTIVKYLDRPGIEYIWNGGNLVPLKNSRFTSQSSRQPR